MVAFDGECIFFCNANPLGQKLHPHQVPRWIKFGKTANLISFDALDKAAFYNVGNQDGYNFTSQDVLMRRTYLGLYKPEEKPSIKVIAGGLKPRSLEFFNIPSSVKLFSKAELSTSYTLEEAKKKIQKAIEECTKEEKPVYTDEMYKNNEMPPVGAVCMLVSLGMTSYNKEVTITYIGNGVGCYKLSNDKEFTFAIKDVHLKPIDTRTDEEKLIDDIAEKITNFNESGPKSVRETSEYLTECFDIAPR